jgi:hypothetical protein
MAKYTSGRQQKIKVGISSYTENQTVLDVTGRVGIATTNASTSLDVFGDVYIDRNLGIGTTIPTSKLSVVGDGLFTGVVTARTFSGQVSSGVGTIAILYGSELFYADGTIDTVRGVNLNYTGTGSITNFNSVNSVLITASGTNLTFNNGNFTTGNIVTGVVTSITGTNLNYSGIGTIATVGGTNLTYTTGNLGTANIVSGLVTSITGTTLNYSGIGTIATLSGTNLTYTTGNLGTANVVVGVVTTLRGTDISYSGIGTVATLSGTNLTYTTGNLGTANIVTGIVTTISGTTLNYSGIGTIATLSGTNLTYTTGNLGTANVVTGVVTTISGTNLNYTGVGTIATLNSTLGSITTLNGVNVSYTTGNFTTGNIVTGVVTTISGTNLNYTGVGTITNLNATYINSSGIITATQFSTGASGTGINITSGSITGPSTITIDPAGVGDNTGAVRIKGDLYVDGTQFIVNSSTIELADFNVGIATTVASNTLLDGAGIGIGSTNIRKTFTYDFTNDALKSSENFNLPSGKTYKINGTDVLSATTLGAGVVNSSLTSVGTLTQLRVTGVSTFTNGPVLIGSGTSTGTASQRLQVTGGAYVSGEVGIGTAVPRETLDVIGTVGVQASGSTNRFEIQHNSTLNSLDFIFI